MQTQAVIPPPQPHDETATGTLALESEALSEAFFDTWLSKQCAQLTGARAAVLFTGDGAALAPVALWPDEKAGVEPLVELTEQAAEERCGLMTSISDKNFVGTGVAFPLEIENCVRAVIAVLVESADTADLQRVMDSIEWGSQALSAAIYANLLQNQRSADASRRAATDLLALVIAEERFEEAGSRFVIELANLLDCERVTMGYCRRSQTKVRFVSHSAQFGKRMNIVHALEEAMGEAIDQKQNLVFPQPSSTTPAITRAHAKLAESGEATSVMTIPVYGPNGYYAAVTLERRTRFTYEDAQYCEAIAALVGGALEDKRQNDRWLIAKAWDSARSQLQRLLGPRYIVRKLIVILLLALAMFFSLFESAYRLAADVVLEGSVQRVIAAPFAGYLQSAAVRAGNITNENDVIAVLDDRDLRLEQYKWKSEAAQRQRQLEEALGARDRAQIRILTAQVEQAQAELDLVESQLERLAIRAPFDGIVVSGDLSQRLGSAVEQGQELFKIAPLDAYRIIVRVPERRIDDVRVGQKASVLLSAIPNEPLDAKITAITPVTEALEEETVFRVEGELLQQSPRLRPGMEGVVKIDVDRRLLIAIWTRDMVEWLRVKWWAFWA